MVKRWTFFLILVVGSLWLPAQKPAIQQVGKDIRNFHLSQAQVSAMQITQPELQAYYQTRILFYKLIASDDQMYQEPFLGICKFAIKQAERMDKNDPLKCVFLSELYFMRGTIRALQRNIISATFDLSTCCKYLEANRARFPNNPEQKKLLGVFNVALGAIPPKFQWLTGIFCFSGDLETGVRLLEEASASSSLLPEEAEVVMFFFEKNLISAPEKAQKRIEKLVSRYPESFPFRYLQVSALMELRQPDKARQVIDTHEPAFSADPHLFFSPYWDYSKAKLSYFDLDLVRAEKSFETFLQKYNGRTLLADAIFRKGITQSMLGDKDAAQRTFQSLVSAENSGFDEDEYAWQTALRFAKTPPTEMEITLFRARNLFDGGYYARALAELIGLRSQAHTYSLEDRTELHYRIGRIFHESGNAPEARKAYRACIREMPERNLWMKVYAHYYLGKVLESSQNYTDARALYEQALEFDDYFYQSGLVQKCKTALRQLP